MIEASELRVPADGGMTTQFCPGKRDGCNKFNNVKELPIFPYICPDCWLKGWRSRGKFAYSPEENA